MIYKNRLASRLLQGFLASTLTVCMGTVAAWGQTPKLDAMARVSAHPDLSVKTRLAGHVPAWAATAQPVGSVAADLQLDHVTVTLTRPAALEAEFQQLLKDQQDPASPRYHQWLTPQQSADLYGAPQADSDAVVAWLQSQGLQVDAVSPNRLFIRFSGPATTVANAFSVQFGSFQHMGRTVFSTTSEPAVPAALAGVIQGVTGLSEEYLKPAHTMMTPQPARNVGAAMTPYVNLSGGTHWILPSDFGVIYDVNPVYNSGINGSGQHIAIIGGSRVLAADISGFESLAGLSSVQPNTLLTPGSTDPGMTSDSSQGEATLDVDRVIGTAPGATADLVLISSLLNTQIISSLGYIINTLNDPIINMSFGACEATSSLSTFNSFNTLFTQAAGQGISIFVSSGDSEAAGCMSAGGPYTSSLAIASPNVLCTPYVTCVGGTQFSDTASPSTYWASSNGTNYVSALSYIPEGVWNEPTSTSSSGVVSYVVEGGGGGPSIYATKPTWQIGTGVPADNARDTPDMSFSASGHNAYLACLSYSGAVCPNTVTGFGGTSASAPSMAGVLALVNQKTGARQGLFNARLYQLALNTSNGVFHDATPATSGVTSCSLATASTCNTSTPGLTGLTGGLAGAALTTGYDLATGLGSIDVSKLVTAISTTSLAATTTTIVATPTTITTNQSAIFKATISSTTAGTPTGTVTFTSNGTNVGTITLSGAVASTLAVTYPTAGTYTIVASYSGDGVYAASSTTLSFAVTVPVLPATTTALTATPTGLTAGGTANFKATVTSTAAGTPTGSVAFTSNGVSIGSATLSGGSATVALVSFPTSGTFSIVATYSGDSSFALSQSTISFVVTPAGSVTTVVATPTAITTAQTVSLKATVAPSTSIAPTGTVSFTSSGATLGTIAVSSGSATFPAGSFTTAGTYTVNAAYSGDATYAASSASLSLVVTQAPTFTVGAIGSTSVVSGTPATFTANYTALGGFSGTITPTCTVSATFTSPVLPTCTAPTVTLGGTTTTASDTFTITTTKHNATPGTGLFAQGGGRTLGGIALSALLLCLLPRRRMRSYWRALPVVLLLSAALMAVSGCGGASGGSTVVASGTSAGTYNVTIVSTGGGVSVTTTTTIVVQ